MDYKREKRKHEHIAQAIKLEQGPLLAGWNDIHLVHQALLQDDFNEIETEINLFGKKIAQPLIINALTGGASGLEKINGALARVAKETGIGLAVGSQTAGINNRELRYTYEIVRKINPDGLVLANVSALANPKEALEAVKMVEADILQLHINGAQELLMAEGDRDFVSMADNIMRIMEEVTVPCIVKEVGFGISRETAERLYELGIRNLDISGAGGTNFAAIELARYPHKGPLDYMKHWGITSACSLLEVKSLNLPFTIVASGGIYNPLDILKALNLGADVAAIAGYFLKILVQKGEDDLLIRVKSFQEELKMLMMMVGAKKISDISRVPRVIDGFTYRWCEQRGIKLT
jgi:isopentenyl-diphosphate delta-isomerase